MASFTLICRRQSNLKAFCSVFSRTVFKNELFNRPNVRAVYSYTSKSDNKLEENAGNNGKCVYVIEGKMLTDRIIEALKYQRVIQHIQCETDSKIEVRKRSSKQKIIVRAKSKTLGDEAEVKIKKEIARISEDIAGEIQENIMVPDETEPEKFILHDIFTNYNERMEYFKENVEADIIVVNPIQGSPYIKVISKSEEAIQEIKGKIEDYFQERLELNQGKHYLNMSLACPAEAGDMGTKYLMGRWMNAKEFEKMIGANVVFRDSYLVLQTNSLENIAVAEDRLCQIKLDRDRQISRKPKKANLKHLFDCTRPFVPA